MLKERVLTALIILPLIISAIIFLDHVEFAVVLSMVILIAAYEWGMLSGLSKFYSVLYSMCYIPLFYLLHHKIESTMVFYIMVGIACVWWLCACLWVILFQRGYSCQPNRGIRLGLGLLVLCPCWFSIGILQMVDPWYDIKGLLFLVGLISVADIGAYFIGSQWGQYRLVDQVSPKKTLEGCLGGMLAGVLWTLCYSYLYQMNLKMILFLVLLSLWVIFYSIIGDLLESIVKRWANQKDSGCWLPGHGGILDRIDSLTAAAPIFLLSHGILMR